MKSIGLFLLILFMSLNANAIVNKDPYASAQDYIQRPDNGVVLYVNTEKQYGDCDIRGFILVYVKRVDQVAYLCGTHGLTQEDVDTEIKVMVK